jgi:peptide/nickel transport system permease protein
MNRKILIKRMWHDKFFASGLILMVFILIVTFIAPYIVAFDPIASSLMSRFQAPEFLSKGFSGHIFGTDQLGRDIFTRLLIGGKYSLMIAFAVVVLQTLIGTILGLIAGYVGGFTDSVIMRLCDIFLAFPNIILAIAVIAILGPSVFNLILVFTLSGWVRYCRVTRNNVMVVKKQEFVKASRVLGASDLHIMFKQIFPNVTTQLIILASNRIGQVILTEAVLSYLSLGIPAPTPSWGNMISDGRSYLSIYPWTVFAPGVALMLTVLAFNFLGDGLRDVLDPKKI